MKKKKKLLLGIIISMILATIAIVISLSSTNAIFTHKDTSQIKNNYNTGLLSITAISKTDTISLDNTLPMSDEQGLAQEPYIFTIKNNGNVNYQFDIQLLSTSPNTFDPQYIKLKIDNDEVTTLSALTNSKIKTGIVLAAQQTIDISLKVWLASNTPNTQIGKSFTSQLVISGVAVSTSTNYGSSAASYITNLYNNASKTKVLNNETYYNYAISESLMNDRLGGITKDLNAGNIRYFGKTPNNYIYFNCSDYSNQTAETCEVWRIIGVFDNMVKIIRGDVLGAFSWDVSSSTVNNGYGINQWGESTYESTGGAYSGADAMKLLNPGYETNKDLNKSGSLITVNNSLYWNAEIGTCYGGPKNTVKDCDFTSNGLKNNVTRNKIAEVTFFLGTVKATGTTYYNLANTSPSAVYHSERGTDLGFEPTDDVVRTLTWNGKIALMYPSDYLYATDFRICNNLGSNYGTGNGEQTCYENDWIYIENQSSLHTITPDTYNNYAVVQQLDAGYIRNYDTCYAYLRPVLYLNAEESFVSGNGTSGNPYKLR